MKILVLRISILFLAILPLSGQEIDLEDRLVLLLHFDGSAVDESGENVAVQVNGPVLVTDRFGNPASAYMFDGIDDCIGINHQLPLITSESFSISLWARINGRSFSPNQSNSLFEQRDDESSASSARSTIHFNAEYEGQITLNLRSSVIGSIHAIRCDYAYDENWHHYVAILDEAGGMRIYVDGQLYCQGTFPSDGDFVTGIDHVNLGSHHYGRQQMGAFNGVMDEVYIYNRALNLCEIEALYSGQLLEER